MKILLIQPSVSDAIRGLESSHNHLQPLSLSVIASLTPEDHQVKFVDDRLEEVIYDPSYDLVGITTTTITAKRTYQISDKFRELGVPVIIGGHHATLNPKEVKQHADSVLLGEAEGLWGRIVKDFESKSWSRFYQLDERPRPEDIETPDRSIFNGKDYMPVEMVETTRGCPHNCTFCSVTSFFGPGFRHKEVGRVVEELRSLDGDIVFFVDDNVIGDKQYARALFKAIKPLNIHWFGQASIQMAWDEELLKLMKESGCVGNLIGLESINSDSLAEINKSWNETMPFEDAVSKIHAYGLSIYASFVLGMDSDRPGVGDETYEFASKSKFLAANFNYLTTYPGTKLFERLKEENRIFDESWWLNDRYNAVRFKPEHFSPEELWRESYSAKRRFYSYKNIARRATNFRGNSNSRIKLAFYWLLNKALHDELDTLPNPYH